MNAAPILVGVDFSDGAALALAEAKRLAARLHTEVCAVHVVETFAEGSWTPDTPTGAWLDRWALDPAELVVRQGFPWVELVRYGHEVRPAMIVVGSHGVAGFQPLALGSTAARLAVLSPFPVLVVTSAGSTTNVTPRGRAAVRIV